MCKTNLEKSNWYTKISASVHACSYFCMDILNKHYIDLHATEDKHYLNFIVAAPLVGKSLYKRLH